MMSNETAGNGKKLSTQDALMASELTPWQRQIVRLIAPALGDFDREQHTDRALIIVTVDLAATEADNAGMQSYCVSSTFQGGSAPLVHAFEHLMYDRDLDEYRKGAKVMRLIRSVTSKQEEDDDKTTDSGEPTAAKAIAAQPIIKN